MNNNHIACPSSHVNPPDVTPRQEGWFDTQPQPPEMLASGAWIALFGGGQLGSMFCDAAQKLGFKVVSVDPTPDAPIANRADAHWTSDYNDPVMLDAVTKQAAVATIEFENIPYIALAEVARAIPLRPSVDSIQTAQDRAEEKAFFARHGLPVVPFLYVRDLADLNNAPEYLFPGFLKTARFGYDGKGQYFVDIPRKLRAAFDQAGAVHCVFEALIDLKMEISVQIARDAQGNIAFWPIAENQHRNNILDTTIAPARVSSEIVALARQHAQTIVEALGYQGVLCVEFFVDENSNLFVNEMAPRPHNSGHHTIESCITSQFEQQARIVTGLPLGDTTQKTPAVMVNLLGDLWFTKGENAIEPDWQFLLKGIEHATLHLYGKKTARHGRKMGHITFCAPSIEKAMIAADTFRTRVGLPPIASAH